MTKEGVQINHGSTVTRTIHKLTAFSYIIVVIYCFQPVTARVDVGSQPEDPIEEPPALVQPGSDECPTAFPDGKCVRWWWRHDWLKTDTF
jgi:hypothetical protein